MDASRILWLTENYPPQRGGMAQSCDRIVDGLRNRGHCIDVFHFTNRGVPFQTTLQMNGTYITIPVDESESHTLNMAWNIIRKQPPSALVCFGGYLPVLAAPVYSKWLSVPLICLVRGNDFDSAVFTPRRRDLIKDALLASAKVCVVSRDKVEKIEKLFPGVNAAHVSNGIDVDKWIASTSETKFAEGWRNEHLKNKVCIGIFGQLKAKKGIDFFIRSFMYTQAAEKIHLLLIGEIAEEVTPLLGKSGFSYTHYPFMDRFELLKYYLCCDAMAIPSFYDGMPNVLLEAGALEIPVLASSADGMKDLMAKDFPEQLFDPGDAESCLKAIYTFLDMETSQRARIGLAMRDTIRNHFNSTLETNHYEKIFLEVLGRVDRPLLRMQPR